MDSLTDQKLLRDYSERRSELAFSELVRRHVDLVHSAALRMVRDPQLAEDVTQEAFAALARGASRLGDRPVLSGWLHRTAQNIAVKVVRTDVRRRAREQEAAAMNETSTTESGVTWEHIAPRLDAALGQLNESDRDALLLRYFERKSAREMGQILGMTEEAAQKRVSRSVERLRELLGKRGVAVGTSGLIVVISANGVQAAPAGLIATISASALAGKGILTTATTMTAKALTMTLIHKTLITAALVAGVATPLAIQHRTQARLRDENQALRGQLDQQVQLASETERLSSLIAHTVQTNSELLPAGQLSELLRLRGEVGRLRSETLELAQLKTLNPANPLRAQLERMPDKYIPELQGLDDKKWAEDAARGKLDSEEGMREALGNLRRAAKIRFVYRLGGALNDYIKANDGRLPNDISDLKPHLTYAAKEAPIDEAVLQRYELLHTGKLSDLPAGEALIGEKSAVDEQYDTLFKITATGYTMEGVGKWTHQGFTNLWNSDAVSLR